MSERTERDRDLRERDDGGEDRGRSGRKEPPETARHPAPGIEHEPEPSSKNLIPTKDRPGTL